jgi:hypothetical protein
MYTQDDLALVDGMNKQRLREACKAAEIKNYSTMTVEAMREALRHHIGRALVAHAPVVMEAAFKPVVTKRVALEMRNGITKPREGGICRRVWDWLDDHSAATAAELRAWAESEGLNVSNAQQEASRWRKFNGIVRVTRKAA